MLDYGAAHGGRSETDRLDQRWEALKSERSGWEAEWWEIAKLCAPQRGRFLASDRNRGGRRHQYVLNEAGIFGRRTLAAGLMSNLTPKTQAWFELSLDDQDLADWPEHKEWLTTVRDRMMTVMRVSNLYNVFAQVYSEVSAFGTACAVIAEDYDNVVHLKGQTIGQYALATDERGLVTTMFRELDMTVEQVVGMVAPARGMAALSQRVRDLYDKGSYDETITVRQALRPRPRAQIDRDAPDGRRLPYQSIYWEVGASGRDAGRRVLLDTGFEEQPLLAPRWEVTGADVYGYGPGSDALGGVKQLQLMEKSYGVALEFSVRPPLMGPESVAKAGVQNFPGGKTFMSPDDMAKGGLRPLYEVQPRLAEFNAEREAVTQRVERAFFADVIQAISNIRRMGGADPTATEIQELVAERITLMGPSIDMLQVELIEPAIDRIFAVMNRAGLLPPPPEGLQGQPLKINHISAFAQAARAQGSAGYERTLNFASGLAALRPDVVDVLDADEMLRGYADAQGLDPDKVEPEDDVAAARQARAQQQQNAQAVEQSAALAGAARDVGAIPTQGGASNPVADLLEQ